MNMPITRNLSLSLDRLPKTVNQALTSNHLPLPLGTRENLWCALPLRSAHGHLDDMAVHTMDSADHAGGWSVNASVTIPDWDRHGLERLVRYCARPPLSQERLSKLNDETLVYSLRKPTADGRTELVLTPLELDKLLSCDLALPLLSF